jgi:uncharacterized protein
MSSRGSAEPKRILSLDGGGVRGALSIAFLERIEALLGERAKPGRPARLCDFFDLIGGTSTGAIIGTALALGLTAADIKDFYFHLAPRVFRRPLFRLKLFQAIFDSRSLKTEIDQIIGDRRLDSPDLLTNIAIITKRMDTGSAWIVTNNPKAKYWDDPEDGSFIGNRCYRLADLVRASTAAPYYFSPHEIQVVEGEPPGLFVDGGVSPFNNPALALFQLTAIPAYGFGWPVGEENLLIVSVGTGARRDRLNPATAWRMPAVGLAIEALRSVVADASSQALVMMQALGRTDTPWVVNSEVGDMGGVLLSQQPLFTFQRYDVRLEREILREEFGISLSDAQVAAVGMMENAASIPLLYEIGQAAAGKLIKPEHLWPKGEMPLTEAGSGADRQVR